jgi:putative ATP-binding cassette transporter
MRLFKHPLWSRFVTIAWPFFVSEARAKAIAALAGLVALLVTVNGLNFITSYVMRDFMTALEQRHAYRFYVFGGLLAGAFGLATIAEVFAYFAEQKLGLVWREWLTRRLLDRYLAHQAYHRLTVNQSIDNPDQRISEDAKTFTASSLSFIVLIVGSVLTLLAFLGVLWSITPWLVLTAVLYSAAGSLGTILLGRRLVPLNNRQLQKEADFRFALGRVREHADTVAHSDCHEETKTRLLDRLNALVANFRQIINVTRNVGFFTKEYNYLIQIIPAAVVAPLYFHNRVPFGTIPQSAMAFGQVVGAFSLIVTKFQEVSTFAAVANRLGSMWEATESADESTAPAEHAPAAKEKDGAKREPAHIERTTDNHRVAYQGLTLWTPKDKRVLVRDLSVEVPEGKRMIVTGPRRSGKTALCLATAGLWGEGRGEIICPDLNQIMFLPQRLYTATGRLRDLLLFGLDHEETDDKQLRDALCDVGLDRLGRDAGGLDSEWDWPNDLSAGDRHALALARLLLAKPRFAVLDGVPWALGTSRVERLFQALARTSITYISFGGASNLLPYHDLWLELRGEGEWGVTQTAPPEKAGSDESFHTQPEKQGAAEIESNSGQ